MIKRIIAFTMVFLITIHYGITVHASNGQSQYESHISGMSQVTLNAKKSIVKTELANVKSEKVVSTKYDLCQVVLISDKIYYIGYDYDTISPSIFTLDNKNKIMGSAKLAVNAGNISVKQLDDKIYVTYNTMASSGVVKTGLYCKIFDKDLNLISEYNLKAFSTRFKNQTDINESKIFYVKDTKLYSVGFNGKNKKAILDLENENCDANYISAIAATNNYVAFTLQNSKNEYYYGVTDLTTGKSQIIKNNDIDCPQICGESIMWASKAGFKGNSSNVFESSRKITIFKDGQFKTIKTKTDIEAAYTFCNLTNSGEVVTLEFSESKYGEECVCVRMYDIKGKCIKEFVTELPNSKGYHTSSICADDGLIAINFRYENKKSNGGFIATTKLIEY